jgi:hypothetical protein
MSFIVKAVKSVVKAVVGVVSSVVKAVVGLVADVISFVASPFLALLGVRQGNAAEEAQRQEGVLIQRSGSNVSIPVVYGYRRLAGTVVFCETGSTNNKYLWVAYAFSEGLVEGINELFIDDNQISADVVRQLNSGLTVDVPDIKYRGRVKFQWFPGVQFTNPASSPIGTTSILKEAPSWKSSHVFNGMAVLMARYEWLAVSTQEQADSNPFNGQIPQVTISMLGKRVASLRSGAGTENYEYGALGYTERYSTNPAECLLDYLRNPRYGKGMKNSEIDWTSFYIAAAKCNQEISYSSVQRGPILTFNYVVDTSQTIFNNVKNMLMNFRGYLPYVQGKYKLKIEDAGNPTDIMSGQADIAAIFNRDTIVGDIQYTGVDRNSKVNQVVVTYVDPDQKFSNQQVVYPETESERQIYINYDGGRENKAELTMGGITNQQIAKDMARLAFMKARFQETCSIKVNASAFSLEPGDNIFIQSNVLNFGDVPWRIVSLKLNNDYTFDLGCVRNPDFIYPYVVPNTPDRVIAPYIPKGASILPPLTGAQSLLGLTPPVRAPIWGTQNPNTSTNPPRTVTTGTNGGGIGGSLGAINVSGGPEIVNINEINLLRDYVTIETISYSYPIPNQAYAEISFYQPDNAMYQSLYLYYKKSTASVSAWDFMEITDRPGPGRIIRVRVGPLDTATGTPVFDLTTRVKYVTEEFSQVINSIQMSPSPGGGVTNPIDYQETISPGWNIPVSGVIAKNDYIAYLTSSALIVSGIRNLSMTVQQDLEFHPANPDISGVKIFYKTAAATYWNEIDIPFIGYANGSKAPIQLGNLGAPGAASRYDMIFRFAYKDLTYSTWQTRYTGVNVEPGAGIDPFLTASRFVEQSSSYSFMTVDQAVGSGTITNPIDMKIGIAGNFVSTTPAQGMTTHIVAPDVSAQAFWAGVKVYYRQVIPGANPSYTSQTFYGITSTTLGTLTTYPVTVPVQFDVEYQYLIVPLVLQSGNIVEGNYGWFGQSTVHNSTARLDFPTGGNWIARFSWRQDLVALLKNEIIASFPTSSKVPVVLSHTMENLNPTQGGLPISFSIGGFGFGGSWVYNTISEYYKTTVSVQHLGGDFSKLYLFRRHNKGLITPTNNFYGLGRWERIEFNTSSPEYASGIFTLNLRTPTSYTEYLQNTSAGNFLTYDRTIYDPTTYRPSKLYTETADQMFLVIETVSEGISSQAIKLNGYNGQGSSLSSVDLINTSGPPQSTAWPLSDASSYTAGRERNLSEALTYVSTVDGLIPYIMLVAGDNTNVYFYGGGAK